MRLSAVLASCLFSSSVYNNCFLSSCYMVVFTGCSCINRKTVFFKTTCNRKLTEKGIQVCLITPLSFYRCCNTDLLVMARKVEEGFVRAQSDNLPEVNNFMVAGYFSTNDCYSAPEVRGVKEHKVTRANCGDSAVGYVQVRRDGSVCTVKCKICPEHRVKGKNYDVVLQVDEKKKEVLKVECLDCAASAGGCKHAVAFLLWVHRRSEDLAPTEVQCYWKKSQLSKIGTSIKFMTVAALGGVPVEEPQNNFFEEAVLLGLQSNAEGEIFKFYKEPKYSCLSIYTLLLKFVEGNGNEYKQFIQFCQLQMHEDVCYEAAVNTPSQADDSLWHRLRYGRITASKLYTAAHCHSEDGTFVQQVIGATKLRETKAMERGRKLEKQVLHCLEEQLQCKFNYIGIRLSNQHPIFGASPDAVFGDHVVEVKCPSSTKTITNYLTVDGKITARYKAQVQLQMHILQKKSCIFSVADPEFEKNKKLKNISVLYDKDYIEEIMLKAEIFWEKYVFPVLLQSAIK